MATESSIMDSNSFKEEYASMLSPKTREMISKREKYLGGAYRLFYRKPLNIVRGEGDYLWDDEGNKYLDMYNNVAGVGHCNPAVVNAVTEQMKTLNTHTRYLHEKILDYSEELLALMPDEINKIMNNLKTGECAGPIEDTLGYAVIVMVNDNDEELKTNFISYSAQSTESDQFDKLQSQWLATIPVDEVNDLQGTVWADFDFKGLVKNLENCGAITTD